MDVAIPTYQNPGGLVDTEAEFMNVQFCCGSLGIILGVLRLDVSVYNVYITSFNPLLLKGGRGVKSVLKR